MAEIVLIHGIANEQYGADMLEAQWLPAIASGVRTAGHPELADRLWRRDKPGTIDVRMAFYGHLFLKAGGQGVGDSELANGEMLLAEKIAEEWLCRTVERGADMRDRAEAAADLRDLSSEIVGRQGLRSATASTIRSLSHLRWLTKFGFAFAERFVVKTLNQVTRYLTEEEIREEAQRIISGLIGPETKIVVAHSLGSVAAYEAVHLLRQPLPLLVTLGSPLGLNTIVYDRVQPQPPTFPKLVRRWVNAACPDDIVAAEPNLKTRFSINMPADAIFEETFLVENGAEPHRAEHYLTKAVVGQAIAEVVGGADFPVGL